MFLRMLRHVTRKYRWKCHAYCLMSTHFHLVVTTPEPNIGRCMQSLNSVYAREFNKRYGRLGHLVSARYSSRSIETEGHALEVCRYVPLNPVRAGLCARPEDWYWSSYAGTIGVREELPFVDSAWVLRWFGHDVLGARRTLRDFVDAGVGLRDRSGPEPALELELVAVVDLFEARVELPLRGAVREQEALRARELEGVVGLVRR